MKPLFDLIILGNPKAQRRHKHFRKGTFSGTYDPSQNDKANFVIQVKNQAPPAPLLIPLKVELNFCLPRPRSHYGTGRNANLLKKTAPTRYIKKPDIDNLVKFVFDSLNCIFWRDDTQICVVKAYKQYSDRPRTEIRIWKCEET